VSTFPTKILLASGRSEPITLPSWG